ncbi:hypothetical protein M0R72_08375 [Candidatus Pacearchaeota archaeon]|jgi:hypothetical protein|nr:hypothetical protein [Candidatus Pacearchaeota archaeon]
MPMISCMWMRLSTEAALLGKAAIFCTYDGCRGSGLCLELWGRDACPGKDEIV